MASLEMLYQETNSLLQQVYAGLAALERSCDPTDAAHRTRTVQEQLQYEKLLPFARG
jgi:hypothetical protein